MKIDLAKLPVLEGLIGFFIVVLIITFVGAFAATSSDGGEEEPAASATPAGTPAPDGSALQVSMKDNFFEPGQYLIAASAGVTFDITNDGGVIHNMVIAGADGEFGSDDDAVSDPDQVRGGETATLTWQAPSAPGEVDFRCDFHPTQMTGKITVK